MSPPEEIAEEKRERRSRSTTPVIVDSEENKAAQSSIVNDLSTYVPEEIITKRLTPADVSAVCEKLAKNKDISKSTATRATAELIRKGAANANAKDTMSVEVYCEETGTATEVTRYDVCMALFSVTKHKTVRKLAEAMAPMMLEANLKVIKRVPTADLRGDLASKINRRIQAKAQNIPPGETPPPPLTREEEVCCCTYAQWMPNLNQLAKSTRLKSLMEEDLMSRKPRKRKKTTPKKGEKTDPQGKKEKKQ